MIKTYKEYKELAINKAKEKEKDLSFDKIDDRYYYVYRITNILLNKHYYGSRVSKMHPKEDSGVNYFSSSRDKEFINSQKENPQNYKYKVVKIFDNNVNKVFYESYLHQYFNVKLNVNFYNKVNQTPFGRDTTGMVTCIDKDGNTHFLSKEEYNRRDDLSHIHKGKVLVKDKDRNTLYVETNDPRYLSGELVYPIKNIVSCIDKFTNKKYKVTKEEFKNNNNLVGYSKGYVMCKDIQTNIISRVKKLDYDNNEDLVSIKLNTIATTETKNKMSEAHKNFFTFYDTNTKSYIYSNINDPRYLSGELVSQSKGRVIVKNNDGKRFSVETNDPRYLSGELVSTNIGRKNTNETKSLMSKKRLGLITVIDITTNNKICVTREDYELNDNYINCNSKRYDIYDNNNILKFKCYGNLAKVCNDNNIPLKIRDTSKDNRLYNKIDKNNNNYSRLVSSGNIIFKGWYCVRL